MCQCRNQQQPQRQGSKCGGDETEPRSRALIGHVEIVCRASRTVRSVEVRLVGSRNRDRDPEIWAVEEDAGASPAPCTGSFPRAFDDT